MACQDDDDEKGKGGRREGACVPELVECVDRSWIELINDFSFLS